MLSMPGDQRLVLGAGPLPAGPLHALPGRRRRRCACVVLRHDVCVPALSRCVGGAAAAEARRDRLPVAAVLRDELGQVRILVERPAELAAGTRCACCCCCCRRRRRRLLLPMLRRRALSAHKAVGEGAIVFRRSRACVAARSPVARCLPEEV